jgi:hypothetical protein
VNTGAGEPSYSNRMEFGSELAQALANVVMGWYSNSLSDAQLAEEIESTLRRFGQADLVLPAGLAADILAARPGIYAGT